MRHVPSAEWMARKIEGDVRTRVGKLLSAYMDLPSADPRHPAVETEFRALCRTFERLLDAAKPSARHNGHQSDVASKIDALMNQAAAALHALEPTPFGHRNPYHFFERSKSECVYGALLTVLSHLDRVLALVRTVDATIDERILEGLVVLSNPVDDRMLQPIA